VATEDTGVPLGVVSAGANRHDSPLLAPTLHAAITQVGPTGEPTPIQNSKRWVTGRTHAWMNGYGKLRRCTDRNSKIVNFYLYLAAAFVTVRALIREARSRYRWPTRPTTRRLT